MKVLIKDIIEGIDVVNFVGSRELIVSEIVDINNANISNTSLFWCSDKNKETLLKLTKGVAIVSPETHEFIEQSANRTNSLSWLIVEKPRFAFKRIMNRFFVAPTVFGDVSAFARIHETVKFNRDEVNIGHNVVIEENVEIGKNATIGHNTVIYKGSILENNITIGSNCTIGGVGFGYEQNDDGEYDLIPHIGIVRIKVNADIGNNVCVDRAVLGETLIGENVKIDNLVHIAHGVKIGKNSLIIANSMIAGSVEIGENVWVSPSSSIIQKAKVADNSIVGMGSVVLKNVDESTVVAGVPAKKIKEK